MPVWYANFKWACAGALAGIWLVDQAITTFLGPGRVMPDDRLSVSYAIPIGTPLGGYLGWRVGPGLAAGLRRLRRRR